MSNQNFVSATTRAIYKLRTPDDKPITMKELIDMCGLYANPDQPTATFEIVKLYEAPDGGVQIVSNSTVGTIEFNLVSPCPLDTRYTTARFLAYTHSEAVLPGKPIVLNLTDENGKPILENGAQKQMVDVIGIPAKTYVEFVFDTGSQNGEIECVIKPGDGGKHVQFASMQSGFPFGVKNEFSIPPIPVACNGTITDDQASHINNP